VADVCASFQATVVKMLVRRAVGAARRLGIRRILLTGGVAANRALRAGLEAECAEHGYAWTAPPPGLCTDNGAMIAAAGVARLRAGERATLGLNARATLPLA
jgi:N6-L-threonylcarbamoyladenine synthase